MLTPRFAIAAVLLVLFASSEFSEAETVVVENLLSSGKMVRVICRSYATVPPADKILAPHQVAKFELPRNSSWPLAACFGRIGRNLTLLYSERADGEICRGGKCIIIVSFDGFYRWNNVGNKWEPCPKLFFHPLNRP